MIIWDKEKYNFLKQKKNILLDEIVDIIFNKKYIKILENSARENQKIFIIDYKNYVHVVPFITDMEDNIVIKTVYPSRKFNKIYGGKNKCVLN
ncbi:MAG: toxin [bacterium]